MTRGHPLLAIVLASTVVVACGAAPPTVVAVPSHPPTDVRDLPSRPPLAVVVRDGDPRGAVAVAVLTAGVDDDAGARVPVALAAVTESRLAASGVHDVTIVPTWDGYRVRALLPKDGDGTLLVRALREALVAPLAATGSEADAAAKKLAALSLRPLEDPILANAARCNDEPRSEGHADTPPPPIPMLERWRAASQGLGRVVFGAVGTARDVDRVASILLAEPPWPVAGAAVPHPISSSATPPRAYDASTEVSPGSARVTVVLHTGDPAVAVATASTLGAAGSALARRLRALDAPASLRDVTATAQAGGGCISLTLDIQHDGNDRSGAIATTAAIAEQEGRLGIADAELHVVPVRIAALAGNPLDAADLAAWWTLVATTTSSAAARVTSSVVVGVGAGADSSVDFASRTRVVEGALEHAGAAWQTRVVDARTEVERGQGPVWLLVGSPCGTLAEADADAGLTALAVSALAEEARGLSRDAGSAISEWITSDGVGLLVRVERRDGEGSAALARRAGDVAGASMMANAIQPDVIARARAALMTTAGRDDDTRSFGVLSAALTPGHPSWSFPLATGKGLEGWSDGAVAARVAALRHGPVRVAVLGNDDAAQTSGMVDAFDRWVTRSPGETRACPASAAPTAARPGTYAAPPSSTPSAWLAIPLPRGPSSAAARDAALVTAAALDGRDGLLSHALSSGLASSWAARVIGPKDIPTLVIRIGGGGHTLDAAVAQVRALLDHLRQGAFTEADRTRALARLADDDLATSLEPQGRLVHLWRGDPKAPAIPSLEALHTFLADTLHDDTLVIVASRPPLAKVVP